MELFAALLCAVRPFSGSPFPRPLVFIELVTGFVVWSAFAFVELGCFVRPVRAFVLSELPLLVTRSSPKKKKKTAVPTCPSPSPPTASPSGHVAVAAAHAVARFWLILQDFVDSHPRPPWPLSSTHPILAVEAGVFLLRSPAVNAGPPTTLRAPPPLLLPRPVLLAHPPTPAHRHGVVVAAPVHCHPQHPVAHTSVGAAAAATRLLALPSS